MKLLTLFLTFISINLWAQSTYVVDASHSSLVFSLGYNYSDFYGSFGEMDGKATMENPDDFSTAKVEFNVNIASINTNSKNRDGHLQGERYFKAEEHAAASFESKHIQKTGDDEYEMTGALTIAGVTMSQTVDLEISGRGSIGKGDDKRNIMGVKATFSFNRSNFGISAGIPKMSDKVAIVVSLNMVEEVSEN
jgi:polyisoprenoid-binding protein YceI